MKRLSRACSDLRSWGRKGSQADALYVWGTREEETQQPSNNPNKIEHELSLIWGRLLDGKLVRRREKGIVFSLSKLTDGVFDSEWSAAVTFRAADARRNGLAGWSKAGYESDSRTLSTDLLNAGVQRLSQSV